METSPNLNSGAVGDPQNVADYSVQNDSIPNNQHNGQVAKSSERALQTMSANGQTNPLGLYTVRPGSQPLEARPYYRYSISKSVINRSSLKPHLCLIVFSFGEYPKFKMTKSLTKFILYMKFIVNQISNSIYLVISLITVIGGGPLGVIVLALAICGTLKLRRSVSSRGRTLLIVSIILGFLLLLVELAGWGLLISFLVQKSFLESNYCPLIQVSTISN